MARFRARFSIVESRFASGLLDQGSDFTLEGSYKLAKVKVLGVPAITVASPIDESSSEVMGASVGPGD